MEDSGRRGLLLCQLLAKRAAIDALLCMHLGLHTGEYSLRGERRLFCRDKSGFSGLGGVERFLNHADGLFLVTESGESAESKVIGPVEPSVLVRMFHTVRPVVLRLEITSDAASARDVLLLGLGFFISHHLRVQAIKLCCLRLALLLDFLKQIVELTVAGVGDAVSFTLVQCHLRRLLLLSLGKKYRLAAGHVEIAATRRVVVLHLLVLLHFASSVKLAD